MNTVIGLRTLSASADASSEPLRAQSADLFSGLSRRNQMFLPELQGAMAHVLSVGELIDGPSATRFERNFAQVSGTRQCVGVASGMDALVLALQALGIGHGDEVVVPAQTFVATLLAVQRVGATPVSVDVDPETGLLRLDLVEDAITPRTRAVIAVHLHGSILNVSELRQILQDWDEVAIVEDAAQAHGASDGHGTPVGALGDIAAFSFYPTKNLGALGDGGCVTTNREELALSVRELSRYGSAQTISHRGQATPSGNSRLDTLQAAFLDVFLPHLGYWNKKRLSIAHRYQAALGGVALAKNHQGVNPQVFHHFVIRSVERDRVADQLAAAGIPTRIHYAAPAYRHPALGQRCVGVFHGAELAASTALSIPMHPWLSDDEVDLICSALQDLA